MPATDAKKPKVPKAAKKPTIAKPKKTTKKKEPSRMDLIRAEILKPLDEVDEGTMRLATSLSSAFRCFLGVRAPPESCMRLATVLEMRDNKELEIVYSNIVPKLQVDVLRNLLNEWNPKDTFATCEYQVTPDKMETMYLSYEDHGPEGLLICICPLADR